VFVRVKQQGGRVYHYLVAAERSGGRVRQKTVAYLGDYPSVEAALEGLPAEIAKLNLRDGRRSVVPIKVRLTGQM
jgi:hypothetical protein